MPDHGGPVEVTLVIAARPGTIFRYFTDPARFARWMGEASVLDPEPGGRLRVGYPTGQVAGGRVVAVEPDRRIVFTWGYEGDGQAVPAGSSTVEITLEPAADGAARALPGRRGPVPRPDHRRRRRRAAGRAHRHGPAAHRWGPGEVVLATGSDVAGTDLDGRFRWLTGFWDPPAPPEAPEQA